MLSDSACDIESISPRPRHFTMLTRHTRSYEGIPVPFFDTYRRNLYYEHRLACFRQRWRHPRGLREGTGANMVARVSFFDSVFLFPFVLCYHLRHGYTPCLVDSSLCFFFFFVFFPPRSLFLLHKHPQHPVVFRHVGGPTWMAMPTHSPADWGRRSFGVCSFFGGRLFQGRSRVRTVD